MDQEIDLFGNPIVDTRKGAGRPPHEVTTKNRNRVKMLVALGWANPRIANALAISLPTLRKNYFQELKARDAARDQLDARRFELAWELAEGGNVGAFKEFGRLLERNDRMEVERELGSTPKKDEKQPSSERLGKKQLDEIRARDADADLMAELEQEASQNARH
ncbi:MULTISPECIES: hypothetical protein [Agrobacterium]|uniref:hypothetical protein n=1 Tax=Agrobacterium TaxID=357 RepID=UPI00278AB236|nr:hypothetical protein [Agrobacterium sp. SORGH_AS_0745]MDP9758310.1 hypothetical protein [Agrobacterium tumefaciens]MDQ1219548.1 hypothetical protein [Agrobacterium sp. SORGH_AS_0745]